MACAAELPLDGQLEPSWLRIASGVFTDCINPAVGGLRGRRAVRKYRTPRADQRRRTNASTGAVASCRC